MISCVTFNWLGKERTMSRAITGFIVAVLLVIISAKYANNISMDTGDEPVNEAWAQQRM